MIKWNNYLDKFWKDLTVLGGMVFYLLLLLVALGQDLILFYKLLFGFLFTLIGVVAIRMVYFKKRPRPENHSNFIERMEASSFPSLHMARIVFLGLVFTALVQNSFLKIFLLVLVMAVAYSRIYLKKHDWWDLLGGLILGLITFWLSGMI